MRKFFTRFLVGAISIGIAINYQQPASAVDYQDFRTPIIMELKQTLLPIFENGENFLNLEYELTVKSFGNQLSTLDLSFLYESKSYLPGCQLIPSDWQPFRMRYGAAPVKLDSLSPASGLVSLEKFVGYQIEKHKFTISTKQLRSSLNTKFKFCDHTLKLDFVSMWDVAGHRNLISFNHSDYFSPTFYHSYPNVGYQFFQDFSGNSISHNQCPNLNIAYDWYTSEKLYSVCGHTDNLASLSIVLSPEMNDQAKAAADKAAADKAAADKAAADKAAIPKSSTIICVKGKVTKKVTAIKPKCPSGYKKK